MLINRWNGPRYQRVLALYAFLTGVIPKGLILKKICVRCLCMFYVNLCTGLILRFLNNLWFDDLRAELIVDRLNIVFSRDVIHYG